jgi:ABC-2 type transport system ATP-binding protein
VAGTASAFAVELRGVGKAFGEVVALPGINLVIPRLPGVGFVGPSGGGKTTLLRVVAGLLESDTGLVRVLEADHRFEGSRREIVTSPGFVSLTEQALEAPGS